MWEWESGDSWFAHLVVNQPFDVPNTNMLICSGEGGNDETEVAATLPLFTAPPPFCVDREKVDRASRCVPQW